MQIIQTFNANFNAYVKFAGNIKQVCDGWGSGIRSCWHAGGERFEPVYDSFFFVRNPVNAVKKNFAAINSVQRYKMPALCGKTSFSHRYSPLILLYFFDRTSIRALPLRSSVDNSRSLHINDQKSVKSIGYLNAFLWLSENKNCEGWRFCYIGKKLDSQEKSYMTHVLIFLLPGPKSSTSFSKNFFGLSKKTYQYSSFTVFSYRSWRFMNARVKLSPPFNAKLLKTSGECGEIE